MEWKKIVKIALIAIGIALALGLLSSLACEQRRPRRPEPPKQSQQKKKKQVRFQNVVRVVSAGGQKADRYNPTFRPGVTRNSHLARNVGGARRLAQLSLLEAAAASSMSASSSEEG